MIPDEIDRLARTAAVWRSDWPVNSLRTSLANFAHSQPHRTVAATAHALLWIAMDPATQSPGRLAENGPWWGAQPTVDPRDKPAYYGPSARFCDHPVATEDGLPVKCGGLLVAPDEVCDHRRAIDRESRRAGVIADVRQQLAHAQGTHERAAADVADKREQAERQDAQHVERPEAAGEDATA